MVFYYKWMQVVQLILFIPSFGLGLIFNVMALVMVLFKIKKWTESTTYIVNLIVFDILLILALPFKISVFFSSDGEVQKWSLSMKFCSFLESTYIINMYGSILISMCISMDRYIAIVHPFSAMLLRSPRIAIIICVSVWIFLLIGVFQTHDLHIYQNDTCFGGFSNVTWTEKGNLVISLEVVFLISALVMVFCSAQTIRIFRRLKDESMERSKNARAIIIVSANLATFLVCFTPYHIALFLYYLTNPSATARPDNQHMHHFTELALSVANMNCCLDALCYYNVVKEFSEPKYIPKQDTQKL
ncbi:G-protein coupled receptor 55-like [Protopterus annectens]|uniref:G-protein coupled receptor 55-like n=1 Tax=Protopterus annectens TaxID=7888 RepID=UPI001CFBA41E|nr:G-protein coupled receptor 55-like [Protopterus annectens]